MSYSIIDKCPITGHDEKIKYFDFFMEKNMKIRKFALNTRMTFLLLLLKILLYIRNLKTLLLYEMEKKKKILLHTVLQTGSNLNAKWSFGL